MNLWEKTVLAAVVVTIGHQIYTYYKKRQQRLDNELDRLEEFSKCESCMTYFDNLKNIYHQGKDISGFEEYAKVAYESKNLVKTEECRKKLAYFWYKTRELYKMGRLNYDFFDLTTKPWLVRGLNYKNLVEPIDRYNYQRLGFARDSGKYEDGNNRPAIFVYLEEMEKDAKYQNLQKVK
jgi:hypothetical protein